MPLPLAQAIIPGAYVEPFDPIRDCRALYTLATWCLRFSPLVALDDALFNARVCGRLSGVSSLHYGITIDLTGTEKLHGAPSQFAHSFRTLVHNSAHVAVAPTLGAAWALSRYGAPDLPVAVSSRKDIPQALSLLPVPALRLDEKCTMLLSDVGITVIGQILRIPRHLLSQRFGKFLLYRLEQALGSLEERLNAITPPRTYASRKVFEPPLSNRKSIIIAINYLFSNLLAQLKRHSKCARSFFLTLYDTADKKVTKEFPLAAATDDISHLTAIIEPIVEGMNFFGEVHEITLCAEQIEDAASEQRGFASSDIETPSPRKHDELMNTLSVRLGKSRIMRASLTRSYIPEGSFAYYSALNEDSRISLAEPIAPYNLRERPSLLLPKPEPISTISMLPDKPPSFLQWRGRKVRVVTGIGPERIAPEWWGSSLERSRFSERDYFKVQDDSGRWLWVYRDQGTQEWFLHGIWA